MELLEMELIKKLQSTQAIQKEAYAELEEVLQSKPQIVPGAELLESPK